MKKSSMRTPLAVVRGTGSAKEGTGHFIMQRITAIALIPLAVWFIFSLLCLSESSDAMQVAHWLSSGLNATALICMVVALFYHAKLGIQTIIEDYVHCSCWKVALLLGNLFGMGSLALISILAVLKLHLAV